MDSNMIQIRNINKQLVRSVKDDYKLGPALRNSPRYTVVLDDETTVETYRSTAIVQKANQTFLQNDIQVQLENNKLRYRLRDIISRKKYDKQSRHFFKMRQEQAATKKLQEEMNEIALKNLLEKLKKPMDKKNRIRFT